VQQSARPTAGAEGKVSLLHQARAQAAHRRITRHASPDNATTDDQHIERSPGERFEGGGSIQHAPRYHHCLQPAISFFSWKEYDAS
jgi:hypothetical protein